ncbi:helix-turn-helix domain-containing protein [Bradyrhizobium erythrophlei]|uniref:AraC family transcriptional regulator n=1 Tax=Bradyrhizobium erythrophlei TaxID=1437360 RepID=A0A1M5P4W2_9BRAD|nr:AraC family transcriptional regulator [Bradyrhizobium erythrophlei]SHG96243.1 AraC family transcriptional regulator [Bradyrhizobium erythrophlei]
MMTSTPSVSPGRVNSPDGGTDRAEVDFRDLEQIRPPVGIKSWQSSDDRFLHPTVQIAPVDSVKRLGTGRPGWFVENVHAPIGRRVELQFQGPVHLLAMYNEGGRRDGETSIDGFAPSKIRNVAKKLTFVPAGCGYREWLETAASTRLTFLYLDPTVLRNDGGDDYAARIHFEDSGVWETATKLKSAIENGQAKRTLYLSALSSVLAIELSRCYDNAARDTALNRGGLACWQKRAVVGYIEEHLGEQICLSTLAQLARLSQHHFCRAFKQSFGVPPHHYHVQRRIEQAKLLLADRSISITDIGFTLGYSQTSSFSVAFRKNTGWTPSEYRREFK